MHRLSNDVEISWFFLWFIVLSLNLNTLYLTIRRYDASSLFVTYRPLSHGTHCVSQSLLLRSSSLSHLKTFTSPLLAVPHPSTGNHRIADPQTKIQTYSTTKNKQTNKQYTTNIIIPVLHVTVTSTPLLSRHYLCIMHTTKHTSLVYIQYI